MRKTVSLARVRPALAADAEAIFRLAQLAGTGLTTLPADSAGIGARLRAHEAALEAQEGMVLLVLEDEDGVFGTGSVVTRLGLEEPFFSYKISEQRRRSELTGTCVTTHALELVTDFVGDAEVGTLFVGPQARKSGAGRLIARSRYLFMALHRTWFPQRCIAELRGVQDEQGNSPFWDAVGRHFYNMSFAEADLINGRTGSQIIRELGPREPIHVNLLPQAAQDVIGKPHKDGRRAFELLVEEGFEYHSYIDIFDAGPTVVAEIDKLRALREGRFAEVRAIEAGLAGEDSLVALGTSHDFRAARGAVRGRNEGVIVGQDIADLLGIETGNQIYHVPF